MFRSVTEGSGLPYIDPVDSVLSSSFQSSISNLKGDFSKRNEILIKAEILQFQSTQLLQFCKDFGYTDRTEFRNKLDALRKTVDAMIELSKSN